MEVPPLDRNSSVTLSRQLLDWFRRAASDGSLPAGEALPATRTLAAQLGVSRNTVCEAYELLAAEGYIECSTGARARIARGVAIRGAYAPPAFAPPSYTPPVYAAAAPRAVGSSADPNGEEPVAVDVDLRTGLPDPSSIPRKAWARALLLASENSSPSDWLYGPPEGIPALRTEIASYLFRARGMRVQPERVFVTAGATHALHLLALVMARRGRSVAVEDPCHLGMVRTLRLAGLEVVGVAADESGMKTASLAGVNAALAYVTPSHQFPLGGILSAERRVELVSWARQRDAWIAEDDYDAEFRYVGPPVAPLWTLESERTIYVGTFSKTLFPALRIGYAIVPPALEREWREARVHADVQNPPFEQLALARLLADRSVDRHVARMRRLYGRRREALLSALDEYFPIIGPASGPLPGLQVLGDASGLHVAVRFPGFRFDRELVRRARADGIRLVSVARHSLAPGGWEDTLLLGYGHLDEAELRRGIARIAAFMATERPDCL